MVNWTVEGTLQLTEIYKNHTVLWNPKDSHYYKKNLKEDAWKQIASLIRETEEACKSKIISLLASFRRDKSKVKKTKGTGTGTSEVYCSRWFAYEAFQFLADRDKPRKKIDTEAIEEDIDDQGKEETNKDAEIAMESQASRAESAETDDPSATPTTSKRAKGKQRDQTGTIMSDALAILKTAATKLSAPPIEKDKVLFHLRNGENDFIFPGNEERGSARYI